MDILEEERFWNRYHSSLWWCLGEERKIMLQWVQFFIPCHRAFSTSANTGIHEKIWFGRCRSETNHLQCRHFSLVAYFHQQNMIMQHENHGSITQWAYIFHRYIWTPTTVVHACAGIPWSASSKDNTGAVVPYHIVDPILGNHINAIVMVGTKGRPHAFPSQFPCDRRNVGITVNLNV